jgi:hypothetical protein
MALFRSMSGRVGATRLAVAGVHESMHAAAGVDPVSVRDAPPLARRCQPPLESRALSAAWTPWANAREVPRAWK